MFQQNMLFLHYQMFYGWNYRILSRLVSCVEDWSIRNYLSGQYRLDRFGGPQTSVNQEMADRFMALGMDADNVGKRAVEGVQRGDFYIVTHPHNREYIVSRYNEILNAYDTQAPHFEGDEKYDVQKIFEQMMNQ
jgi:hypothetical protein